MRKPNHYEILFDEMLEFMEFELIKYPDGFGIRDLQGGNIGNIEDDRFEDACQLIERLDCNTYFEDYFVDPIKDCLNINNDFSWSEIATKYINHPELAGDSYHDIQILDMICHHPLEVDLNNCIYKTDDNLLKSHYTKKNVKILEEESKDSYLTIYISKNITTMQFYKDYDMAVKYAQYFIDNDPLDYDEYFEEMANIRENANGEYTFIQYLKRKGYIVKPFKFDLEFEW